MRIETLHHADIKSTNQHILELLLWLHHLVAHSSAHNVRDGSSAQHLVLSSPSMPPAKPEIVMLNKVMKQTLATSGSLKLGDAKAQVSKRTHRLATSSSDPPTSEARNTFPGEGLYFPVINSDSDWLKVLDIIDGVESI